LKKNIGFGIGERAGAYMGRGVGGEGFGRRERGEKERGKGEEGSCRELGEATI